MFSLCGRLLTTSNSPTPLVPDLSSSTTSSLRIHGVFYALCGVTGLKNKTIPAVVVACDREQKGRVQGFLIFAKLYAHLQCEHPHETVEFLFEPRHFIAGGFGGGWSIRKGFRRKKFLHLHDD